MISLKDIFSLTDFQRSPREHLRRLKRSGKPEVLTVNGRAAVVVQDAASYQDLIDLVDFAQAVEGIQRGLDSLNRGDGQPVAHAMESIRKKHRIPRSG